MGASVTINGKTYTGKNSVSFNNGNVIIDGKIIGPDSDFVSKGDTDVIRIEVSGDLLNLSTDKDVTMIGNITGDVSAYVVKCDNIGGDVSADSVLCEEVKGDVNADCVRYFHPRR